MPHRRRGARGRGAAERPLHHRVPPARQGDRPDRPGRRAACACAAAPPRTSSALRAPSSPRRPRSTPRTTSAPASSSERDRGALPAAGGDVEPAVRRRGRGRRGRRRAHRHPGRASWWRASSSACTSSRRDLHERVVGQDDAVEVVADTIRRARVGPVRGRPPAGHASCSSARPASARPSWSRRSPSGCSRPRRRSCASTCPSTASRTRSRG